MMNRSRMLRAAALLLCCVLLLASCGGGATKLTYEKGLYQNEKKGVAYRIAPITYRAASYQNEEIVATVAGVPGGELSLYAITDMDAAKWLTDESYAVYYEQSTKLPTLRELKPNCITLCKSGTYTVAVATVTSAAEIADIVELYEVGTTVPREKIIPPAMSRFELLFTSSVYEGLMYSLEYWVFASDVEVFAPLTESGEIPDLYPGIRSEIRNGEAVFHLGENLVFDRNAECFYAVGDLLDDYFTTA